MGLNTHGISRCSHDDRLPPMAPWEPPIPRAAPPDPPTGNPNPGRFRVARHAAINGHTIAEIVYPDCSNYEGRKVLLYRGVHPYQVVRADRLDPHFCEGRHLSPFARFEPTPDGWAAARQLAMTMDVPL